MFRTLRVLLFLTAVISPPTLAHASRHRSPSTYRREPSGRARSVYSRGYMRKNGTYVAPYMRIETGATRHPRSIYGTSPRVRGASHKAHRSTRDSYFRTSAVAHHARSRNVDGRIERSGAAKDAFKRQQPCPSTGRGSGACPGYVIDHVKPLECGGADAPSNMQWQTIAAGKAKDKTERYCR